MDICLTSYFFIGKNYIFINLVHCTGIEPVTAS